MLNSAEVRIKTDLSDAYDKLGAFAARLTGSVEGGGGQITGMYQIGDRGPAGGWIFYDKGIFSNGWRYLEAAPAWTEFEAEWGAYERDVSGTSTAVGTGKRNTELIVAYLRRIGESGKAAQLSDELIGGTATTTGFCPARMSLI
jgi:hypothetical protein